MTNEAAKALASNDGITSFFMALSLAVLCTKQ